jgi:DIM1 family U5 snRNP protein
VGGILALVKEILLTYYAELYDPVTLMFFFRNKHMMCDFGTGNNNKLNWVLEDKQELIDIIETIYRGAKKGRGLVVSPKGM